MHLYSTDAQINQFFLPSVRKKQRCVLRGEKGRHGKALKSSGPARIRPIFDGIKKVTGYVHIYARARFKAGPASVRVG